MIVAMERELRLRRGVRAVVVDDRDRVLLVRFEFAEPLDGVRVIWATPGGGVEDGEDDREALTRELAEEVGRPDPTIGPAIWTRTHVMPLATGHDGQRETYYLVRTPGFEPAPGLTPAQLRAENVTGLRWWTVDELGAATDVVFAPRRLPELMATLLAEGPPPRAVDVGV
jgi:8-oxo-dGTP diphosphatase